jgi:hypothetical protein
MEFDDRGIHVPSTRLIGAPEHDEVVSGAVRKPVGRPSVQQGALAAGSAPGGQSIRLRWIHALPVLRGRGQLLRHRVPRVQPSSATPLWVSGGFAGHRISAAVWGAALLAEAAQS